jgi:NAD(P)-dependent dehydrogenase (short-subunit alcohol dehydrogenase family)
MSSIFITGASSGIGKATARYFAEKGWDVIATMRSPEKQKELSKLSNVLVLKLDVERKDTIEQALSRSIEQIGKIDVLLNNAGYGTMGLFESATDEQIRRQFDVNVFGLMNMTKATLPHFRANQSGMIINVSSMGGKVAFPTMSLYHATKFAVEGFTESLLFELLSQKIRVKLIEPGMIKTDFFGRSIELLSDDSLTNYREFIDAMSMGRHKMEASPQGQPTSPDLVAEVIYQAATDNSDQLRYVVGEDAKALIKIKEEQGDRRFLKHMSNMYSLPEF